MTNYIDPADLNPAHRIAAAMCEREALEDEMVSEFLGIVRVTDGVHIRDRENHDICLHCGLFAIYGPSDDANRKSRREGNGRILEHNEICFDIADYIVEIAVEYNDDHGRGHMLFGVEAEAKPSLWAN